MISIRSYQSGDIDALIDIWYEAWHGVDTRIVHPQPKKAWRERWQNEIANTNEVIVAVWYETIVGFAALDVSRCELSQIFVLPSHQGMRVGTLMINWAKNRCPDRIQLSMLKQNAAAQRFYTKHGFIFAGSGINPVNGMETVEYIWSGNGRD